MSETSALHTRLQHKNDASGQSRASPNLPPADTVYFTSLWCCILESTSSALQAIEFSVWQNESPKYTKQDKTRGFEMFPLKTAPQQMSQPNFLQSLELLALIFTPYVPRTLNVLADVQESGETDDDTWECELIDIFAQRQMLISVGKIRIYYFDF